MLVGLGCFPSARRYSGNRFCFLFLQLLRCFNSLRSLVPIYGFNGPFSGLPHSETPGSTLASNSPGHIVGNHVLRRLCVPRYPPWALLSLTTFAIFTTLARFSLVSVFTYLTQLPVLRSNNNSARQVQLPDFSLCSFQGASLDTNPAVCLVLQLVLNQVLYYSHCQLSFILWVDSEKSVSRTWVLTLILLLK